MNRYESIVQQTEAVALISPSSYLGNEADFLLIDVRTPAEYQKGHIPGAVNIPLFSDEERAVVGTAYKQQSKEKAVQIGMSLIAPKLDRFVNQVRSIIEGKKVAVHCWRGGLRSRSFVAHLLKNEIMDVVAIEGGYKAFRKEARELIEKIKQPVVLSGHTGTGKTDILLELKSRGEQVVDLEGLASHKGSAFGHIGQDEQPTSEHFLNLLLHEIKNFDFSKRIWLEDEGHSIGKVDLPTALFDVIRSAPTIFLDMPRVLRSQRLVPEYAGYGDHLLAQAIQKIRRRLGGQFANAALEKLNGREYQEVAMICLQYYDKYYKKSISKRDAETVQMIETLTKDPTENTDLLLAYLNEKR